MGQRLARVTRDGPRSTGCTAEGLIRELGLYEARRAGAYKAPPGSTSVSTGTLAGSSTASGHGPPTGSG